MSFPAAKCCRFLVMCRSWGSGMEVEYMYFPFLCYAVLYSLITALEMFESLLPRLGVFTISLGYFISCIF